MPKIVSHSDKLLTALWGNAATCLVSFSALNKPEYFPQSRTPAVFFISILFGSSKGYFRQTRKEEFKLPRWAL